MLTSRVLPSFVSRFVSKSLIAFSSPHTLPNKVASESCSDSGTKGISSPLTSSSVHPNRRVKDGSHIALSPVSRKP